MNLHIHGSICSVQIREESLNIFGIRFLQHHGHCTGFCLECDPVILDERVETVFREDSMNTLTSCDSEVRGDGKEL